MAAELRGRLPENPLLIGIHTGGVRVGKRLHRELELLEPMGTLDISFYRDDFSRIGLNPEVKASNLPVGVEDRNLLLVDDVLHTGRTIRAALEEIFSYGRPNSVTLVVLIDREGRELPIQADVAGQRIRLEPHEQIKLSGDRTTTLSVIDTRHSDTQRGENQ
ncbi:MAG: bifunctional pyr operon transcriptional regulator/uracil phosphoribosyltransferase PyrR [Pseudomonadota bacterium]|nr:bifunctional pyr operon transcriptional regulator/uracil phosphoribosyltransferase PyrR [Pseudomonadota bacterium]